MARIVMLGSAFDVRGGVSAMARVCAEHGLFERWDALYLETHCDGSVARKAWQAARAWLAFMRLLLTGQVAMLHVHLNSDASFWRKALFIAPARAMDVPYILQLHCGAFEEFFRERCSPRAQAFVDSLLRGACAVLALSEVSRQALRRIVPGLQVSVLPNPVAIPVWQASLDSAPPTVVYLGMLKEAKGVYDLLHAWPAVLASTPEAHLVLAGAGEIDQVRATARGQGVEGSVETPGWVSGAAKDALLRRAHVFVLPSHWEALPMSVLEAMAAGVPVVATQVGGVPYAVASGRTGFLVGIREPATLAAAITRVLSDAGLRKSMGCAGRERAEAEFSASNVLPALESLWRGIVPECERVPRAEPPGGKRKLSPV